MSGLLSGVCSLLVESENTRRRGDGLLYEVRDKEDWASKILALLAKLFEVMDF
jgi:hypothetical protein